MCDKLNVSYDRFIRTSQPDHYRASQAIWSAMEANGDLYLGRYEGWYSVRDEAYYDDSELIAGEGGEKLSPQGTPVEWTVEESWFFKLSAYQQTLLDLYAAQPKFIQPESRRNEVLRFVEGGLSDLSISRTSFDWGVPVPGSPGHVMYVWLDALTNYITGLGYPDDTELWRRYWPADLHLIGKDVVRFHTVYWPAFLMSAGLALAEAGVRPRLSAEPRREDVEKRRQRGRPDGAGRPLRGRCPALFPAARGPFGQDGSYSAEAIVTRANAELANSFGNLAQRTLSMIFKNFDGVHSRAGRGRRGPGAARSRSRSACQRSDGRLRAASPSRSASRRGCSAVFACNAYVDTMAPWALRKTDPERMAAVLGTLVAAVRRLAEAVAPVIPASAEKLIAADRRRRGRSADRPAAAAVPAPRARGSARPRNEADRQPLPPQLRRPRRAPGRSARQRPAAGRRRASSTSRPARANGATSSRVAERNADVWATVGVHPHEADAHPDLGAEALVEAASHPRVIAIGECGLDYYYDKSDRGAQRERFQAHIEAARETGLPLVVHTREAEDDTAEILERGGRGGGVTGVLHCFTGSAELARKALDLGFYISLSGIVTFKNAAGPAGHGQMAARRPDAGRDRFARSSRRSRIAGRRASRPSSPTPRRSSPSCAARTPEALAEATTANFFRLFESPRAAA